MVLKKTLSQRGSIMIETVAACMILVILMLGCLEVFTLITSQIHLEKIAREGAREAAIVADIGAGKHKAEDIARQYYSPMPNIEIYTNPADGKTANVVCSVSMQYRGLKYLTPEGIGVMQLNAEAIYPWHDET